VLVVWVVVALLASLLALLAVPVDVDFVVQRQAGKQQGGVTLVWLFGLVRLRPGKPKTRARARPARRKVGWRRTRRGTRRLIALLRVEGFGWRLLRLAQELLRRIHVRELDMQVRLGLDDPADTGRLWAVVGPLAAMLASLSNTRVAVEPAFTAEALDIDGKGGIRIIPVQLLWVLLVFALSPDTRRALHTARAAAQ